LLFSSGRALALNPSKSVFQYNCRTWARQNGIPANSILAIKQTPDGYMWLGTPRGLVRFDGGEFKLFDMSHLTNVRSTIITSLAHARGGGLWFGLERGSFGYFDGKDFSLMGRTNWGGESLLVQSILQTRDGDVWIAAETLAARLNAQTNDLQFILNPEYGDNRYNVLAVFQDSHGRVWFGTAQRGLYYWENNALQKFPDPALDELAVHALVEDKQGQLWVGTDWGLRCYDSKFQRQTNFPFPWYEARTLLVDHEGTLWIGTSGGGIARYVNGTITHFRRTDGLADDFVSALAEDNEGSLWVGTRNGLSQLNDVKIPTYGKTEGLSELNIAVRPSCSNSNAFWIATDEGFTFFDGSPHSVTNAGFRNRYLVNVHEARNGDLYVINGSKDIEIFSNGKIVARHACKVWPTAFAEDAQSVIVSMGSDVYRVGTNFFEPYKFAEGQKPPLNWIHGMMSSKDGATWVAGDLGICRIEGENFRTWTTRDGLPDSKVIWICEDKDSVIWAGLETGLVRLKGEKISLITQENGLYDNIITAIVPDDYDSLWIDSSRGFFSVNRQSVNDFADGKSDRVFCRSFDGLDAIKSAEKYQQQPSGCKTADGRIWFPTAQGVVMIDPTNLTANPVPPSIHIQQVLANGKELDLRKSGVVRPGNGNLEFHYAGLSYIAPMKIQYRYMLHGFDKDWVDAGARRAAFYTNLKPGKYEFQIEACNGDSVWNDVGARFTVELLPHYYQTAWFYGLCVLSGCAVLGGIYAWRTRHLRRKQETLQAARDLLENKVTERTAALADANGSLKKEIEQRELEVQRRVRAQTELEHQKEILEKEIEERKRMQIEIEQIHRQLVDASRAAGQAEVASSVLHNVGNVLNSVNVSTNILKDHVRKMRSSNLEKAVEMIEQHHDDLADFLTSDEKGRQLPRYLGTLSRHLTQEQDYLLEELKELTENVSHINEIVAMQQNFAKASGVLEKISASDLIETAIRMNIEAFQRHSIEIFREYENIEPLIVDKHKLLQILVNIFRNAKQACKDGPATNRRVVARIKLTEDQFVRIEVADNGVGIAAENLTRIFSHGFTTRKDGHGYGLHSSALAAKEMDGSLSVRSDGIGKGATFTLEIPLKPVAENVQAGI
jgi:ligand-binding sensor domain-containing protein/signal transduction histidine kinase